MLVITRRSVLGLRTAHKANGTGWPFDLNWLSRQSVCHLINCCKKSVSQWKSQKASKSPNVQPTLAWKESYEGSQRSTALLACGTFATRATWTVRSSASTRLYHWYAYTWTSGTYWCALKWYIWETVCTCFGVYAMFRSSWWKTKSGCVHASTRKLLSRVKIMRFVSDIYSTRADLCMCT